mgnify:FL=1
MFSLNIFVTMLFLTLQIVIPSQDDIDYIPGYPALLKLNMTAELLEVGARCIRGPDWSWKDQVRFLMHTVCPKSLV